jgi:N-acetyl sugar amidotransferase
MINHCKRCLYPSNHALNLVFDSDGICSGCRIHEEKDEYFVNDRSEKLTKLLNTFKNKLNNNYDCIIPVTGAQDSFYTVDLIVSRFGLNPLLVNYNSHFNTPVGARNLSKLRMKFGLDLIQKTVSPDKVKKVVKSTFRQFGSIYWHVIAGQTVFPVQMAVQFKIPLVIWGAHQGLDQTGMFSHNDYVEMTRKYRKDHDCMGYEAEDLINQFDHLSVDDVNPFIYPSNREIERVGVRGIYLNNYVRWDTRQQHEKMVKKYDYEGQSQTRTFDSLSNQDCYLYSDLHDYIKLVKHGYGKVNDHVAREIRLGHMNQSTGLKLINQYITKRPKHLSKFCSWLGVHETGFNYVLDQFRNEMFWKRTDEWEWDFCNKMPNEITEDSYPYPDKKKFSPYVHTQQYLSHDDKEEFILIGKGYS